MNETSSMQIFMIVTSQKGVIDMRAGFIGAGKVGCSLYDYFVHNNIPVIGCYTRTQAKVSGTEKQTQKIFTTSIDKILTKSDVLS